MDNKEKFGSWVEELITKFKPDETIELTGTPKEMTSTASWKAFAISFAAAIPYGPFGMATIFPELLAIMKIQINLVYRIAKYYGKTQQVTPVIILHVLATALGIAFGRKVLSKIGTRIIVKALSKEFVKKTAQKLGVTIATRVLAKIGTRWIPLVTAPIFGAYSKMQTTAIGNAAINCFGSDIEFEKTVTCSNGHEVSDGSKFCPDCGEKMEEQKDE